MPQITERPSEGQQNCHTSFSRQWDSSWSDLWQWCHQINTAQNKHLQHPSSSRDVNQGLGFVQAQTNTVRRGQIPPVYEQLLL